MRSMIIVAALASLAAASSFAAQTQPVNPTPPPSVNAAPRDDPGRQALPRIDLTPAQQPSESSTPAIKTTEGNNPGAPVAGANSFTEGQAKSRIEARGFSNVSGLAKDDKGIWRGTAMQNGKSVKVSLDFQGNVVAN